MSSVDTENRQGYDSLTFFCFFLNVFHFWQFLHHSHILTLATFFWILFASLRTFSCTLLLQAVASVFFLGLVENGFLLIPVYDLYCFSLLLCAVSGFLAISLQLWSKMYLFSKTTWLIESQEKICNEVIIVLQVKNKRKKKTYCLTTTRCN